MKINIRSSILLLATAFLSLSLHSSLLLAQPTGAYVINENWAQLPDGAEWDGDTSWVATDGKGLVLVMVRVAPYFRLFNRDGEFLRSWGEEGQYRNAHSVMFDEQGYIWATDAGRHVVYKYSPQGEIVMTLGKLDEAGDNTSQTLFNQPNHVAIGPEGDIYVSDGYQNSRIIRFSPSGEFKQIIAGELGAGPGQLHIPHGVAVDSKGQVIVNDSDNKRVAVFSATGTPLETWPYASRGGLVLGADDTAYVSDVNAGEIYLLKNGALLDSIKVAIRPHGLAVDSDGIIYAADARGRKIIRITKSKD